MADAYSCGSADHVATKLAKQAEIFWHEWSILEETRRCLAVSMCTELLNIKQEQKSLMHCGIAYPVWVLLIVVTEASIPFE